MYDRGYDKGDASITSADQPAVMGLAQLASLADQLSAATYDVERAWIGLCFGPAPERGATTTETPEIDHFEGLARSMHASLNRLAKLAEEIRQRS